MKVKRGEVFIDIAKAGLPELLDFAKLVIPGPLGIVLPVIGKIYIGYSEDKSIKEDIDELKGRIEGLEEKVKRECLETFREVIKYMVNNTDDKCVELHVIDGFELYMTEVDDIEMCLKMLQEEKDNGNDVLNREIRGKIFVYNNALVFNLNEHHSREELEGVIEEIVAIIQDYRDGNHDNIIKKIVFY